MFAKKQQGATLIELMVGITIGLLTVTVSLGALMVSRGVSSTVSDASKMQQQASYAFRVIGQQMRQTAGLTISPMTGAKDDVQWNTLPPAAPPAISGIDTPGAGEAKLSVTYQASLEPIYESAAKNTTVNRYLLRNCLGENPDPDFKIPAPLIQNNFNLDAKGNLTCIDSKGDPQPIIADVKDFQVTYLQQVLKANDKQPHFRYTTASQLTTPADWSNVYAVEICLEIEGTETIDTAGATYKNCSWKKGDTEKSRGNKIRAIYRNTFSIRNQAWPQ